MAMFALCSVKDDSHAINFNISADVGSGLYYFTCLFFHNQTIGNVTE